MGAYPLYPFRALGYTRPRIERFMYGRLAQLVRALRLHRRGRGFESRSAHFHPAVRGIFRYIEVPLKDKISYVSMPSYRLQ